MRVDHPKRPKAAIAEGTPLLDLRDVKVAYGGIKALKGGALVGRPIRELKSHMRSSEARVAAMYRKHESIEPEGDTVIEDGDEVFFVAATQDIRAVMKEMQKLEDPVKRVVIAGGGNIGFRLAQTLDEENQVKVIERDTKRANTRKRSSCRPMRCGS